MQPLDINRFNSQSLPSPKRSGSSPNSYEARRAEPLPMARGQRIRRKSIGLQEILLILLVIMLGVASWVGYKIYKSHEMEKEAAALDVSREQFQQMRDDVIEANEKKKEKDIP